jgi:HD superfamily phosphohydrolase
MFSTVYLHKTVRIASRMLQQAIVLSLEDGTLKAAEALSMGDAAMLQRLSQSKEGGEYARRLESRRLFKKAHEIPISRKRFSNRKLERELSDACGCPVLIDVPRLSAETHVMLETEDGWAPLSDASELVSSLVKMQKSRQNVLVMCEEKNVEKVASRCERVF